VVKRTSSPFTFGSVLEKTRRILYDSFDAQRVVAPETFRLFGSVRVSGQPERHKTLAQCSPWWSVCRHPALDGLPAAQLDAPRCFVLGGVRLAFQVLLADGETYDPRLGRSDVERLKAGSAIELWIGVKVYAEGPAALFPLSMYGMPVTIPPQQQFWATWAVSAATLTYRWRCFVKLGGMLEAEVA
jgi:hypothetical protein